MKKANFYYLCLLVLGVLTFSCNQSPKPMTQGDPQAIAEEDSLHATNFGYQPLDPMVIDVSKDGNIVKFDNETKPLIWASLNDETMRLSVGELNSTGGVTFGPAKAGMEGKSYVVIIDYIKYQTVSHPFSYEYKADAGYSFNMMNGKDTAGHLLPQGAFSVYVGVGLRLTATITVVKGNIDLGNLFAIGLAGEAKNITGTMTVQTLGLTGEKISALIPMPAEVSTSTIQNAILALGTIKSKMYDPETKFAPRAVGFYNSMGGGRQLVMEYISFMQKFHPIINI